ncbi:MAG TPA: hypothetical protein VFQ59_02350 [Candidatus Paceibacterota bacterium]|nr:hypothetical protein [Candidatus Paceibacterota bacterium]
MEKFERKSNVTSVEDDTIARIEASLVVQQEYSKSIYEAEERGEDVTLLKKGLEDERLEYEKLSKRLDSFNNLN